MSTAISILLYIKRSKPSQDGTVPVYMRVTIEGKRLECSADKFVNPGSWIKEAGKVKGNSEEARSINDYLDALKSQVHNYRTELMREGLPINFDNMRKKILKISDTPRSLVAIFQDHNIKMEKQIGKKFAKGTYERYVTSLRHTKEFLKYKYNVSDVDIRSVDLAFLNDFEFYLTSVRKCGNNSAVKYLKNFGKILRLCLKNRWLTFDPFQSYEGRLEEVDGVFLSDEELRSLIKKEFKIKRLEQVRDIFVFCCYTGLSYADVKKLNKSHISRGIDGGQWIFTKRQKTEIDSNIPLLPMAKEIMKKYENDQECLNKNRILPVLSNQKTNSYLKEIADLCGVEKDLTFHASRHTFATTVTLSNGIPIESVSKMMGHKNIKTTQHYAKTLDKTVGENMSALVKRYKDNLLLRTENSDEAAYNEKRDVGSESIFHQAIEGRTA